MAQQPSDDRTPSLDGGATLPLADALAPAWAEMFRPIDPADYVLEAELGRGGMGRVVAAIDTRHQRPVALKLLLSASPGNLRRFVREATITARLMHPSIVPVYDTGRFPSGEPFYSMKRVAGGSLEAALREPLTRAARLALVPRLLAVADAIAYAHSQRIIHRDLKPANILLGQFGEVLVVDWGLAKHLDDADPAGAGLEVADDAWLTAVGTVVGTPRYMAPEQARGEPAGTATDVYALGAVLYHVLAGRPPYPGRSTAETMAQLSAAAPTPLREIAGDIPADLTAIADKAMARLPQARYPTAAELAADLRRYTDGQLVGARRYSPAERAVRWLRRHSRAALAGLALMLGGVALYGVTRTPRSPLACQGAKDKVAKVWSPELRGVVDAAFRATGRPFAADSVARVDALLGGYTARYAALHRATCEATARGEQSEQRLDAEIACLDRKLARAGKLVGLLRTADAELVERAVGAASALEDLDACDRGAEERAAAPMEPGLRRHVAELSGRLDEIAALRMAGRYKAAHAAWSALLPEVRAGGGDALLGETLYEAAVIEGSLADAKAGDALLLEALGAAGRARDGSLLARVLAQRVWMLADLTRYDDAGLLLPIADAATLATEDPGLQARVWQARAAVAARRGDHEGARQASERALALVADRSTPIQEGDLTTSLALALRQLGRYDEAERAARRVLALYREALGAHHPKIGGATLNLASVLVDEGRLAEGERLLVEVRELWTETLGPDHAWMAKLWNNLGELQLLRGRPDDARTSFERSLAIKERVSGRDHPETARTVAALAAALALGGHIPEAEAAAARALAAREKALGPTHPDVAEALEVQANVEVAAGHAAEARAAAERAVAIRKPAGGVGLAGALLALARVARLERRLDDAVAADREALALRNAAARPSPVAIAEAEGELAETLVAAGRIDEARGLIDSAARRFADSEAAPRATRLRGLLVGH